MNPSNENISPSQDDAIGKSEDYEIKCIKKLYYFMITNSQIFKPSYRILVIKKELREKFTENQSNFIFYKIAKRVRYLRPCEK